jgi:hypothetical protein
MTARGRIIDLGFAALAAAQLGAAAWLVPAGDQVVTPGGSPLGGLCLFRALTDHSCPFCGMTRSFVALAHGDLGAALQFHPAGPLMFVALAALLGAVVVAAVRRSRPIFERRRWIAAYTAVALACLVIGSINLVRS